MVAELYPKLISISGVINFDNGKENNGDENRCRRLSVIIEKFLDSL